MKKLFKKIQSKMAGESKKYSSAIAPEEKMQETFGGRVSRNEEEDTLSSSSSAQESFAKNPFFDLKAEPVFEPSPEELKEWFLDAEHLLETREKISNKKNMLDQASLPASIFQAKPERTAEASPEAAKESYVFNSPSNDLRRATSSSPLTPRILIRKSSSPTNDGSLTSRGRRLDMDDINEPKP